jgi:hypothetical protein
MVCAGKAGDKALSTAQWAEITGKSQIEDPDAAGLHVTEISGIGSRLALESAQ